VRERERERGGGREREREYFLTFCSGVFIESGSDDISCGKPTTQRNASSPREAGFIPQTLILKDRISSWIHLSFLSFSLSFSLSQIVSLNSEISTFSSENEKLKQTEKSLEADVATLGMQILFERKRERKKERKKDIVFQFRK
jgi:cell division protein FtsB